MDNPGVGVGGESRTSSLTCSTRKKTSRTKKKNRALNEKGRGIIRSNIQINVLLTFFVMCHVSICKHPEWQMCSTQFSVSLSPKLLLLIGDIAIQLLLLPITDDIAALSVMNRDSNNTLILLCGIFEKSQSHSSDDTINLNCPIFIRSHWQPDFCQVGSLSHFAKVVWTVLVVWSQRFCFFAKILVLFFVVCNTVGESHQKQSQETCVLH